MNQQALFNQDAERALIGALLINPNVVDEIDLEPDELYVERHKWIFRAVRSLHGKGIEPDVVTLSDLFERDGVLDELGGPAYLTELISVTPWSTRADGYARVVRDYARRRRMIAIANKLASAAYDLDAAIDQPLNEAMDNIGGTAAPKRGARPMSEWVAELRQDVAERMAYPQKVWGIPTGFKDVDALIGGIQPSEVIYLAGEPGVGKSKLMLNMAQNMAGEGVPGAVFSMEMSGEAMTRRAVSVAGKVATRLLKSGELKGDDLERYKTGADKVAALPLYLNDDPTLTLTGMRAELSRLKMRHGIQWFALDYLLLLSGYDDADETERSTKLSHGVHRIARDLELAGLSVNSVTKEGMGKSGAPVSKNLRGSGQVVHDADIIAFLVKDETPGAQNIVNLIFTKTRDVDGGNRSIDLYSHPDYPEFESVTHMTVNLNGPSNGKLKY